MAYKKVFKRSEIKYIITKSQYLLICGLIKDRMHPDEYGKSVICNLYLDTPDFLLIRRSIEKPVYKEKLRVRSYGVATNDTPVYLELKKKFKGVVYKRRIVMSYDEATGYLIRGEKAPAESQISREIDWFLSFYKPRPAAVVCYDRLAYYGIEDNEFRVTFDLNVRCRRDRLDLALGDEGERIIPEDYAIMEIKTKGAMPLWLCSLLSENKIYPTSFSKYGTYYKMTSKQPQEILSEHEKSVV